MGRVQVADEANHVVIQGLNLDGRNGDNLPSPSVYGDGIVFRDNDVTNGHTNDLLHPRERRVRPRARHRDRAQPHPQLRRRCLRRTTTTGSTSEASDGARITDNWIYDNADRGVQLFPDAQGTYVARNVIDGNGQGVIFSRTSANNVVENNIITNPALRYNIEDFELSGGGNVARRNCLWSERHKGGGLQTGLAVPVLDSVVTDPSYVNRAAKDFRVKPGSPCANFANTLGPQQAKKRKKRARPVRLRARTRAVWPGGRLRLRAKVKSPSARAAASRKAVLKVRVGNRWRRVATMRLRGVRYVSKPQLGKVGRRARGFGMTRVRRHSSRLKLRAYVPGVGRSNVLRVRIGK